MAGDYRITTVETVRERGSWAFTVRDGDDDDLGVVLLPCDGDPPVRAWVNRCTHEAQRLHREGVGAVVRDGDVVCPKHGSSFDACAGSCDNGPAAGTDLRAVAIAVRDGTVYLTDDGVTYLYEGLPDDEGDGDDPGSTSHLRF
ncbi:Rieske 2Fe-2S domain-containing protein [Halorubrum sp. CBA1125]|uniref:Rieske (2Fe-2S) protein n=1 Tax=Halorubrum sp. CBA1125 TaxID=2668072 RepID=UPI00135EA657|nr:Rieske 2Fe-2S domain-containing protein [Halorubrum sp. CBA1125]MUW15829.1 Rieske 2Fe-2S domain-containing protein [Halorubrum sp. CBA1125]